MAAVPAAAPGPPATQEGVRYFSHVQTLQIIMSGVGFIVGLAIMNALSSLPGSNPNDILGFVLEILAAAIVLGLLGLVVLVLFIVGFIKFYQGRYEHGPQHAANFSRAVVLFVVGYVIPLIGSAVTSMLLLPYGGPVDFYATMRNSLAVSGAMGVVSAVCYALMFTAMVKEFTAEEKNLFRVGTLLVAAGPAAGVGVAIALLPQGTVVTSISQMTQMLGAASFGIYLGSVLGAVGYLLFLRGYRSILRKMVAGEIKPVRAAGAAPHVVYMPAPPYQPPPG